MKLLLITFLVFSLSGCYVVDRIVKPHAYNISETPDGTPTFQKGWDDGCESGIHTYGGQRYAMTYDYKQDINMINNQEYYRAWKDAFTYCRWYVWNWARPFQR